MNSSSRGYRSLQVLMFDLVLVATVPSMSNARLLEWGLTRAHPGDGAGMEGDRRMERRRNGGSGDSPMDILTRLPAVVMLERIPVPTLAIARDGIILFANTAFAEMVGYGQDRLAGLAFPEIFHTVPAGVGALSGVMRWRIWSWSCGILMVGRCGPG